MRVPGAVPDAHEILAIHQERDAGLTAAEIGARHALSGIVVQQLLRTRGNTLLPTPFEVPRLPAGSLAVPLYWLGFIAACGRAAHRAAGRPLILSVDEADLDHVRLMVRDLLRTHAPYEICYSNREGHQAYVRDRDLGEAATHWGLTTPPPEVALPVDHIPPATLPHFLRGLIEGQVRFPPFGGRRAPGHLPSPRIGRLVIPGSPAFVEALRRRVRDISPALNGQVEPAESPSRAFLTFPRTAALALLRIAYRDPLRSVPRAARFVRAFGPEPSG